jgi:hypothetical protein
MPPNPRDLAVFDTTTGSSSGRTRGTCFRKKHVFAVLAIFSLLLFGGKAFSQAANYNVNASLGTFTPITGGTVIFASGAAFDDNISATQTINSFTFSGTAYTTMRINSNGWMSFGAATTTSGYSSLSGAITGGSAILAPFSRDQDSQPGSEIRWEYLSASNETVIQWLGIRGYLATGCNFNYQVRLNHTNNTISFVYGTMTNGSNGSSPQVGIKSTNAAGTIGTNLNSLRLLNTPAGTTCNWLNAVSTRAATETMIITTAAITCPSGTTFTFTPQGGATSTWVNPVTTFAAATAIGSNEATVSWTAPTNANSYNVEYRAVGSCSWTSFAGNPVSATSATLTGLNPLTSYQVRVQPFNSTSSNTCRFSHPALGNSLSNSDGYTTSGYFTTLAAQCSGTPAAAVASLSGSASICANQTKAMSATGLGVDLGLVTQWQVSNVSGGPYTNVSGGVGANAATYTTPALEAGTYYYVCTSTCTNSTLVSTSNELVLTVNALPTIVISAANGGTLCGVQPLSASGASTYSWSPASSLSASTGSSVSFIGTADVTITATGTDANGCVGTAAQAITYVVPEAITLLSSVDNFCGTGGVATLTASSAGSYVYTFESLETAVLSNITANTVDATVSQTSAIRVTGTDATSGCVAQTTKSIGLYPLPSAIVTTTADGVCPGTQATINSGLSAGNFTVSSIPHVDFVAPLNAGVLMNNGVAITPLSGGSMDDGGWGGVPIGFNFDFFGNSFNTLGAGTNGLLMFGAIPGYGTSTGQLGQFTFTGPVFFPNAANPGNVIALLASDMQMANSVNGSIRYWTEGFAPNRRFVIKYNRVHGWSNNPEATVTCVLYETLGMVDVYVTNKTFGNTAIIGLQDQTKTIGAVAPGRSGSWTTTTPEGWRFAPPANYLTTWLATDINGTTSLTSNVDGSTINVINGFSATVAPLLTTTYAISYANATTGCSNSASPAQVVMEVLSDVAPTGVTATSTLTTACPGANIPLASDYSGITDGLTYQWQVSTNGGGDWTDITGATNATYTATQAVASSFRLGIASCGGAFGYSAPVSIALTGFIDCYCASNATSAADEEISNVTVGTVLNNSSDCSTLAPGPGSVQNQYSNYTTLPATNLLPGVAYPISVTQTSCGGQFTNVIGAWIDYNQNGSFTDAGEQILLGPAVTGNQTATGTFTVPAAAPTGLTRMRVVVIESSSVSPCGTYAWGETEDYYINIVGPCDPTIFTPPLATAADPDATVCGNQTSELTAFDFNGVANPVYLWYDAFTGGNLLQISTSNFYTPAPITETTSWYVATFTGTCVTDRFPVTLNWVAPPAITVTNSNPAFCGVTAQSSAIAVTSSNADYAYTWTATPAVNSGLESGSTSASFSVTPATNGVYTYTVVANDVNTSCTTTSSTTVGFYTELTGSASVTQPAVCGGSGSVNFAVNGSGTVFASDFSSSTVPSSVVLSGNSAAITGGVLRVNSAAASQNGGVLISNTTGIAANDFQIDFDYIATAGSAEAADGFSYSYGADVVGLPTGLGSTVVGATVAPGATQPENGSGTGLKLSFDAYTNGANTNGVYLMYNSPVWNQTPASSGVIGYVNDVTWRANATTGTTPATGLSTHVTIKISGTGLVELFLNNNATPVISGTLPAAYLAADKGSWKHAFAGRTGGLFQGQFVDNLVIQYNNFYEFSVDNGATWTTTTPVAVASPAAVQNLARYISVPSCSVDLGSATVAFPVAAPTAVTGGSTCLNGTVLNVSGNGLPGGGGTGTLTYSFGDNLSSAGPAFTAGTATVALPSGATVTSASLIFTNAAAVNGSWLSEIRAQLSGSVVLGNTAISTTSGSGTIASVSLPIAGSALSGITNGLVTLTLSESFDDSGVIDATFGNISLQINYSLPGQPSWFNNPVASVGSFVDIGSTLNVVGTSILPSTSAPTTSTAYAANVVSNGSATCFSATVPVEVTVGQPLTVSIAPTSTVSQVFTLASGYSVVEGTTQTLNGTITIPAGAVVTSTVLQLVGTSTTGFTWGNDVTVSMSGASTLNSLPVANVNGEITDQTYNYTASNIAPPGGDVAVVFTHNFGFGGPLTVGSVNVIVSYIAPVTGNVCPGAPVTMAATTTGGGTNTTYQWNLNGSPIADATAASYTTSPTTASDVYTVTVIDDCNPGGITSAGYSQPLFSVTAGTITGPSEILVNDFTAPIFGAGTWTIAGESTGSTIQWIFGTDIAGPFTAIGGATASSQTLFASGAGGTLYLSASTTTTDGCSIQANVVTVVLGNAIDTPCSAAPITLGNQNGTEWSNAAASAQPGETYGSGIANPGNTIWFSFVAPASGHVSIVTTSSIFWDNYITLFSGSDCTNPGGLTQIGFNDDANFSSQAALNDVTCLTPGATYYIQMRGFGNSIGLAGITLTDLGNNAPSITGLSANITASTATGTCAATVSWSEPTAVDDQGCVTMTSNILSGTSFNVGTTTVTYTATDAQGLVGTASFTVTVNDTQLPTITAPAAVQVTAELNSCTATATLGSASTADNCGVASTTNNAPATFPVGETIVVWTVTDVNGNVATANQTVTVLANPANIWYVDADGDNFGVPGATVTSCSQPVGYAANTTDCNDANENVNPGEIEVCGNAIDDNCNGLSEEGCTLPGENPSNATSITSSVWPNCNSVNGTLVNATVSGAAQTICLTGEDKWHQFVATSEGVSIQVNTSSIDVVIELQTAAGVLVAQENAVAGLGGEVLNHYGLTAGQVYKVGVRNFNSALGTGTYSICARMLKRGSCDYGPGPYTLCQYFKAAWAGASGASYTFTFTGLTGPAAGNVYTRTQNSDICILSNVLPTLPYGSTYNVLISNTFTINNGAGVPEVISVPALAPCSMNTVAQPVTALRASDRCTVGPRFRGSVVASLPWVCGATNWRWEFTELNAQGDPVGLPITVNRGAASNFLNLGTVLQLQFGKTYSVRTAPILSYTGTNYQWGTPFCLSIVGSAGMIADGSQANDQTVKVETTDEFNMSLYPNPTHGTDVNINLSGIDSDNVQIRVVDAMGRQVWSNRYVVNGMLNTNITFERPLANGLYMVEAIFNGEVQTQRMMVQK